MWKLISVAIGILLDCWVTSQSTFRAMTAYTRSTSCHGVNSNRDGSQRLSYRSWPCGEFARPGKNVTGNTIYAGMQLQLLREPKPQIKRVSILSTYAPPPPTPHAEIEPAYAELRSAEHLLGLKQHIVEAAHADQVPAGLAEIDAELPDALLITGGSRSNLGRLSRSSP